MESARRNVEIYKVRLHQNQDVPSVAPAEAGIVSDERDPEKEEGGALGSTPQPQPADDDDDGPSAPQMAQQSARANPVPP